MSALTETVENVQTSAKFFENKWLTAREAAEYLRLSLKALQNMTSNGKIPHYKLGNRNRYLESELCRLLLENQRGVINNGY